MTKIKATKGLSGLKRLKKGEIYDLDKADAEAYVRAGVAEFIDEPKPKAKVVKPEPKPKAEVIETPEIQPKAEPVKESPKQKKKGRRPRKK